MGKKPKNKRVSRDEWLKCALNVLHREGIAGVRIERLARDLGIAKAGFYWHFADRSELLRDMLHYWTHEFTEVVINNPGSRKGTPRNRLKATIQVITEFELAKYDLAMRAWAATDPSAAAAVRRVNKLRMEFVHDIFTDLGFRGVNLEMRTRMFVCYHSWAPAMFPKDSRALRDKLVAQQLKWFCAK